MQVTVISYHSQLDPDFEQVALRAIDAPGRRFLRAQRPSELVFVLAGIRVPIQRLDLYGHGSPGRLRLGDEVLVEAGEPVSPWLRACARHLAPGAQLRLLGCETAVGERGARLLARLSAALGVEVLGTRGDVAHTDFGRAGFLQASARRLLISSSSGARSAARRRSSTSRGAAG